MRTQGKKPGASFYDEDNPSSSNGDNDLGIMSSPSPSPSLPPTKRKQMKSTRPSTNNASKLRRVSAGQGMQEMAASLASVVDVIKKKRAPKTPRALTPPLRLPQDPLERAVITLEADAALSDNEMLEAIDILMTNEKIAKVYATLQTSQARTNLIQRHMAKLREGSA